MKGFSLNIDQITQYLEISPPFLMIDYVDEVIPGKTSLGVKKVTEDEWFFKCHTGFWEKQLCMPGVLQTEAMLQTLALTIYTMEGHKGRPCFEISSNTKFVSKVSPSSQLFIHANLLSYKRGIAKGFAEGKVNDETVCQGEFKFVSPHDMPRP